MLQCLNLSLTGASPLIYLVPHDRRIAHGGSSIAGRAPLIVGIGDDDSVA